MRTYARAGDEISKKPFLSEGNHVMAYLEKNNSELKQATPLSRERKPDVNISHAREVGCLRFSN